MGSNDQERMNRPDMTRSRARQLLESYGSDPARWPEAERAAALALLAADASLDTLRKGEEELDKILIALDVEDVLDDLPRRVLGDFDQQAFGGRSGARRNVGGWLEKLGDAIWPGAPLWKPIAAMSVSLLIGLAVGTAVLPEQSVRDTDETVASSPFDLNVATDSIEPV